MSEVFESIASELGVSVRTVRRLLTTEVRDTRPSIVRRAEQVRRMAARMGYMPNAAARAVATGRFHAAAFLMATAGGRSHSSMELLRGVHDALSVANMHMYLAWLPDERLVEAQGLPKIFREWFCDGVMINYNVDIPVRLVEIIEQHKMPCVWINADRESDCVRPDDWAAGRLAAEHLVQCGYRRIGYLQLGVHAHYSEQARAEGCASMLRAAGRTPRLDVIPLPGVCYPGGRDSGERRRLLGEWLARTDRPDAVVTYSSWTAEALLLAVAEAGLRVPQDLAIVTIEDYPVARMGRDLTTVLLGVEELGRMAVNMLEKKIETPDVSRSACCAVPRLNAGDTT